MQTIINDSFEVSDNHSKVLAKRRVKPLKLNLPKDNIFFSYKEEDSDMGSVYYPAPLFYKLYRRKEKLGEGSSALTKQLHFLKKQARKKKMYCIYDYPLPLSVWN